MSTITVSSKPRIITRRLPWAAFATMALAATPAWAQQGGTELSATPGSLSQGQADDGTAQPTRKGLIEEVVVTATKRETSLHETAMSITAVSSEDIDRRELEGLADYIRFTPGATLIERTVGQNTVIVRGVAADPQGETLPTSGAGNSVGVYLDEAPISGFGFGGGTSDIRLVDMERIEAGDYALLDMSIGVQIGEIAVGIFGRNLINSDEYTWAESLIPDGRAYQLRPRTVGLNVSYLF